VLAGVEWKRLNIFVKNPNMLMRLLITSLVAFALSYLLSGIAIDSFWTAIVLAVVLAVLNAVVRPLLVLLTLPVTFLTLGLFLLVINALMILLADKLIDGFEVSNFWWALLFSLLLSGISSLMYKRKNTRR
jgi:putative membrane protein